MQVYKGIPMMQGVSKEDIDKWLDQASFTSSDSKACRSAYTPSCPPGFPRTVPQFDGTYDRMFPVGTRTASMSLHSQTWRQGTGHGRAQPRFGTSQRIAQMRRPGRRPCRAAPHLARYMSWGRVLGGVVSCAVALRMGNKAS